MARHLSPLASYLFPDLARKVRLLLLVPHLPNLPAQHRILSRMGRAEGQIGIARGKHTWVVCLRPHPFKSGKHQERRGDSILSFHQVIQWRG